MIPRTHSIYDQSLSSFAPEIIKHILANEKHISPPYVKTFTSVGFFADVSGFTKASEKLSEIGNLGTEMLAHKINAYLPHIARKIVGSGGDVVKFAGDAMLCIWPPPPETLFNEYAEEYHTLEKKWRKKNKNNMDLKHKNDGSKLDEFNKKFQEMTKLYCAKKKENETAQKEYVKNSVFSAIQCAIQIQKEYASMDLTGPYFNHFQRQNVKSKGKMRIKKEKIEFRVKLGIGVGKIHVFIVGGALSRCEYLICGDALIQAFDCENDCSPKEDHMIVISNEIYKLHGISDTFHCQKVVYPKDDKHSKMYNINNYHILGKNTKNKLGIRIRRQHYNHLIPNEQNELSRLLTSYVPAAVKPHLEMPQQIWTGELREVTIMFISLPWNARSLAMVTDTVLSELQRIIHKLQTVIYKYQGSLNKFLVDDKGSTVMAVFGLPPVAHENDPARAVLAALELRDCIGGKTGPAAIGLSCGVVFVGIIGSKGVRREYGILGDKVNLAARLMGLSIYNPIKLGEVIVDDSVYMRAKDEVRIEWTDLHMTTVKGKTEKIHIYRPSRVNYEISVHKIGQAVNLETSDKRAIKQSCDAIDSFLASPDDPLMKLGKVLFIEGEIAIGKTSLLGQIQVQNSRKLWFLWGKADQFHETMVSVEYVVWKQIMLGFSSRYSLTIPKNRYMLSRWIKQRRPDLCKWMYLINDIVDLGDKDLVEDEWKKPLHAKRVKNKFLDNYRADLILTTLEWTARVKPIAVVIDELQYLTSKDWKLTRRLCALIYNGILRNLIVFVGSLPMDNPRYTPRFISDKLITSYTELKNKYSHQIITPSSWGHAKCKFFVKKYFDIGNCSDQMVMTVHSQCGGRPGFCENFLNELTRPKDKNSTNAHSDEFVCIYYKNNNAKHQSNGVMTTYNNLNRNEMYCDFRQELSERIAIGLDVEFPVPSYVMSITLTHIDKLTTEQTFILKTAAVICKSKGNNSVQFEEHMIRGCHPVPRTKMNGRKRIRNLLKQLVEMGCIYLVENEESKTHDNHESLGIQTHNKNMVSLQLDGSSMGYVDGTDFDGITDPMPSTQSLFYPPIASVPYKKGDMFKKKESDSDLSEKKRLFIFKHRTLYWLKNLHEEYPRSRIKFDDTVKKLKRCKDRKCCTIVTPRKSYVLRCSKVQDMDEWFKLFSEAMRINYLPDSLMKRMKLHTDSPMPNMQAPISPGSPENTRHNGAHSMKVKVRFKEYNEQNRKQKMAQTRNSGMLKKQQSEPALLDSINKIKNRDRHHNNASEPFDSNGHGSIVEYKYDSQDKPDKMTSLSAKSSKYDDGNDGDDDDLDQFDDSKQESKTEMMALMTAKSMSASEYDHDHRRESFDDDIDDVLAQTFANSVANSPVISNANSNESDSEGSVVINKDSDSDDAIIDGNPDLQIHPSLRLQATTNPILSPQASDEEYDCIGVHAGDGVYEFSYGFLRDIVYNQMLFNQRKQLHTNSQKYITKCLENKYDDKLALLHTRNVECVQRYADMLQGDKFSGSLLKSKRMSSRFGY